MIEKIYKKAIYALARVAVKYIELRKKREQKKIKQNKSANLTNSTKSYTDAEYNKKVVKHFEDKFNEISRQSIRPLSQNLWKAFFATQVVPLRKLWC